ncbi:glycosyltransferase family 32 protein [Crassisporium funariophilum]|nr:glycosyltransferase family 32 protein [Crassisporium funariophilum]
MTSDLPSHSSAVEEKLERQHRSHSANSWTRPVSLSIPGVRTRRLRILVPNAGPFNQLRVSRMRRKRGPIMVAMACLAVFLTVVIVSKGMGRSDWRDGNGSDDEPSTLVFKRADLQQIWKWEVASGHYPSTQPVPQQIGLTEALLNPAAPPIQGSFKPARYRSRQPGPDVVTQNRGVGPKRVYLDLQVHPPNVAYPPRPVPGSVADLDHIMTHCNFSTGKYVRDCLEMLRLGGGLDNGNRLRRDESSDWRYIFMEHTDNTTTTTTEPPEEAEEEHVYQRPIIYRQDAQRPGMVDPNEGLVKKKLKAWEPEISLPKPRTHRPAATLPSPCDPENPRVFHMFWTGPFTDKPYLALMSFLYTQNTGMHLDEWPADATVCRPQFWLWINPGPAASVPNPTAVRDMFEQLKMSPWASPFLHPRFKDVIQFKLWNTTEQLDGISEIKDEWRTLEGSLFNSGGHIVNVKKKPASTSALSNSSSGNVTTSTAAAAVDDDDLESRTGSKSSSSYDRLSVILSDMARFVLCHRFGGIYLDADTLLLRDWEELWGWTGAFAYRWSHHEKYNTAVLRMNKGSALGTFLFRTALKNGLDFHPMTVSRYTADAHVEGLLLRLPDALFDAAWLNTEQHQRERPPQPFFTEFSDFFETPVQNSAAPHALGFNGFFRGSYSYHFHNFWWKPFDSSRNFPDLGPRFAAGEEAARSVLRREKQKERKRVSLLAKAKLAPSTSSAGVDSTAAAAGITSASASAFVEEEEVPEVEVDKIDLDWSTVIKRTFEAYIRGERPNMYGEWLKW